MLTGVTLASCALDAQDRSLAALSGVAFLQTQSGLQVVAASAGENALTRFAVEGTGPALGLIDTFRLSAHAGLHDIVATGTGLLALARWGAAVQVDAAGMAQTGPARLTAADGTAVAVQGQAGLVLGGRVIADDAALPLGDVTALAVLDDGRVLAGSAFDTGVALLSAAGTPLDSARAENGFWHNRVSAIEVVEIGGASFAVVAASGSSSLSVFEIAGDELVLTDHEWDSMMTRFSGVSELATVQVGDMTVIAAGGSDAGLSLFELTGTGELVHLRDIVDGTDSTLDGITGLDMIAHGDGALLVASSERDNGLSLFELEFEFAPPSQNPALRPEAAREMLALPPAPGLSADASRIADRLPDALPDWVMAHLPQDMLDFL